MVRGGGEGWEGWGERGRRGGGEGWVRGVGESSGGGVGERGGVEGWERGVGKRARRVVGEGWGRAVEEGWKRGVGERGGGESGGRGVGERARVCGPLACATHRCTSRAGRGPSACPPRSRSAQTTRAGSPACTHQAAAPATGAALLDKSVLTHANDGQLFCWLLLERDHTVIDNIQCSS